MANRRALYTTGEKAFETAVKVPCPMPTGRWNPRPHGEVLQKLFEITSDHGFRPNMDKLTATFTHEDNARMFGTFPLDGLVRDGHGFQIGFANSVDRSLSLRIFFGTNVFVCSNGMFVGEYSERKMHTKNLDVATVIENVIGMCEEVAATEDARIDRIKEVQVLNPEKLFFEAVDEKALAKSHIISAYHDYQKALDRDREAQIENPGTLWAFQNAVTAQWKRTRNQETMIVRSEGLKNLLDRQLISA